MNYSSNPKSLCQLLTNHDHGPKVALVFLAIKKDKNHQNKLSDSFNKNERKGRNLFRLVFKWWNSLQFVALLKCNQLVCLFAYTLIAQNSYHFDGVEWICNRCSYRLWICIEFYFHVVSFFTHRGRLSQRTETVESPSDRVQKDVKDTCFYFCRGKRFEFRSLSPSLLAIVIWNFVPVSVFCDNRP